MVYILIYSLINLEFIIQGLDDDKRKHLGFGAM